MNDRSGPKAAPRTAAKQVHQEITTPAHMDRLVTAEATPASRLQIAGDGA